MERNTIAAAVRAKVRTIAMAMDVPSMVDSVSSCFTCSNTPLALRFSLISEKS